MIEEEKKRVTEESKRCRPPLDGARAPSGSGRRKRAALRHAESGVGVVWERERSPRFGRVIPGFVASSQLPLPFFHRKAVAAASPGWPAPSPLTVVAGSAAAEETVLKSWRCRCVDCRTSVMNLLLTPETQQQVLGPDAIISSQVKSSPELNLLDSVLSLEVEVDCSLQFRLQAPFIRALLIILDF